MRTLGIPSFQSGGGGGDDDDRVTAGTSSTRDGKSSGVEPISNHSEYLNATGRDSAGKRLHQETFARSTEGHSKTLRSSKSVSHIANTHLGDEFCHIEKVSNTPSCIPAKMSPHRIPGSKGELDEFSCVAETID